MPDSAALPSSLGTLLDCHRLFTAVPLDGLLG